MWASVNILRGIKPIKVDGVWYSPHKGDQATLPYRLANEMIKRGWAQAIEIERKISTREQMKNERKRELQARTQEIRKEGLSFLSIREATGAKLTGPEDVYKDMQAEAEIDRECMWVLHLSSSNRIVRKELVAMGDGNSARMHGREVYRRAIIEGAVAIIMVHNHPSGDPKPSEADKRMSKNMKEAGELLGVALLDFMVIATGGYTSFTEKGLGGF